MAFSHLKEKNRKIYSIISEIFSNTISTTKLSKQKHQKPFFSLSILFYKKLKF